MRHHPRLTIPSLHRPDLLIRPAPSRLPTTAIPARTTLRFVFLVVQFPTRTSHYPPHQPQLLKIPLQPCLPQPPQQVAKSPAPRSGNLQLEQTVTRNQRRENHANPLPPRIHQLHLSHARRGRRLMSLMKRRPLHHHHHHRRRRQHLHLRLHRGLHPRPRLRLHRRLHQLLLGSLSSQN